MNKGCSRYFVFKIIAVIALLMCSAQQSRAAATLDNPDPGDVLADCRDYFRYEWGMPLDMSDSEHGPLNHIYNQSSGINGLTYANGKLSFTTQTASANLTLLQYTAYDSVNDVKGAIPVGTRYGEVHPINTSTYRYFAFRAYSSKDTIAQLIWSESILRYAVTNIQIYKGWHTYSIDLSSATIVGSGGANFGWTQGSWEGLELHPANSSNVSMEFDWIQLLSTNGCADYDVDYTLSSAGTDTMGAVVIDDDTDPDNGVDQSVVISPGSGSISIDSSGSSGMNSMKLSPGDQSIYAIQSGDWATLNLLDPFDMSDSDDINTSITSGVSANFSGGAYTGTFTNNDPNIYLGIRSGKKIDSSIHKYISIRLTLSGLSVADTLLVFFVGGDNQFHLANFGAVSNGTATYNLDMSGVTGWSGQVSQIRVDPINASGNVGASFSLDFVAVGAGGFVNTLVPPTAQSAKTLSVSVPQVNFVQPDDRGGRDFAQSELGYPWNMAETKNIQGVANVLAAEFLPFNALMDPAGILRTGSFFRAYNYTGDGDPQYVPLLLSTTHRVDTREFLNVCFKGWNTTETNSFNSVARFLWHDANPNSPEPFMSGDDIIMRRASHEYCIDLLSAFGSRTEPPQANGAANPWTKISTGGSSVDLVRVDMTESIDAGHYTVIDSIHLRTDHEANTQYAIVVDAPVDEDITLYYNASQSASGGTLIGTLSRGRTSNVFKWNTTAVPDGRYYVYGTHTESGNTISRLAPGRVKVSHSRAQDIQAPVLVCERPDSGYVYDSAMEVAGYAVDENRVAIVEVLVDGAYLGTVERDRYHADAQAAYPNYAETNTPGFQKLFGGSSTGGYGAHTVKIVAIDTAGNETSCTVPVTRSVGQSTDLFPYPDANGQPIPIDVGPTPTPTPKVNAKLQATLAKGTTLNFVVKGTQSCTQVTVVGSTTNSFTSPSLIFQRPGASTINASVAGVLATKKSKTEDGTVYFRAQCSSGPTSKAVAFNGTKVKNKKKAKSEGDFLSKLRGKVKIKKKKK